MTVNAYSKHQKSKSLSKQIKATEQRVSMHRQAAGANATELVKNLRNQLAAPKNLFLAGCIGFILGEVTRPQRAAQTPAADKPNPTQTSPLITALNLAMSVHTLYTALPIAGLMKAFSRAGESKPTPVPPVPPETQNDSQLQILDDDHNAG